DGLRQYSYGAESRIRQVDGTAATYTYDAEGQRVRKDSSSGSGSTEYIYLGGQVIAESNVATGNWTDYIFANGKRIARSESMDRKLHITGTACSTCSGQYQTFQLLYAYVIAYPTAASGTWHGWFEDMALASADGSVYPIYTREPSVGVSTWGSGQSNVAYTFDAVTSTDVKANTYYYHGDQIGSGRLLSSGGGWPVWQGTFLPFGEEYNPQISSNNYK